MEAGKTQDSNEENEDVVIGVGMNVEACFGAVTNDSTHKRWFDGKVQSMNTDGTYNIRFKGGLRQDSVAKSAVRARHTPDTKSSQRFGLRHEGSNGGANPGGEEETPEEVMELLNLLRMHGSKPTTVEDIKSMPDAVAEISSLRRLVRHVYMELQCKTLKLVPSPSAHGHNQQRSSSANVTVRSRAWSDAKNTKSRPKSASLQLPGGLQASADGLTPATKTNDAATPKSGVKSNGTTNHLSQSLPLRVHSTPVRSGGRGGGEVDAKRPQSTPNVPSGGAGDSQGPSPTTGEGKQKEQADGSGSGSGGVKLTIQTPNKTPALASESTPGIASALAAFQATMRKKTDFNADEAETATANIAQLLTVLNSQDPEMWSKQFDAIDQLRAIIIHRPETLNMTWEEAVSGGATPAAITGADGSTPRSDDDDFLVEDSTLLDEPPSRQRSPPCDQPLVSRLCALIRKLAVNLRTALARNGLACIANLFEFTQAMASEVDETIPFLVQLAGKTEKKFIRSCAREAIKQAIKSKANLAEAVAQACLDKDTLDSKAASVVNEAATWFLAAAEEAQSHKALRTWDARSLCPGICKLYGSKGNKARPGVRTISQKFEALHGEKYATWLEEEGMAKHDIAKMVAKPKAKAGNSRDKLKQWKLQQKKAKMAAEGSGGGGGGVLVGNTGGGVVSAGPASVAVPKAVPNAGAAVPAVPESPKATN